MRNEITAEQCVEAARDSRGFVTTIAKRLGCTRSYVYKLAKKFKTFQDAINEEREGVKDFAEGKLMQQIDAGNVTAIIFYLKTQGKDRGYIERQEQHISGELQQPVTVVEVVRPDNQSNSES